ncbi:patatin-like phospholipase family protein (plasmid) [Burkholderia plantarii]|uniref:patatin-like phospholipase family protein n=1 Tax=Burkholderia plantarii TaxID=41899 RepID=UPI00272D3611|nr:patatin-like phospholipase family protein [Burkholderia plantarii]WLE64107.1 patatin-like phospholipase family protein [Burkholderia plantarii]
MKEKQTTEGSPLQQGLNPPVFLVFQGGGARGIAHVGGLAAVNGLGLHVAGVAGTSAGAIMAALVAAGYSADQLLNPADGSHLLQCLDGGKYKVATNLFSRSGWLQIRTLRGAADFAKCAFKKFHRAKLLWKMRLTAISIAAAAFLGNVPFLPTSSGRSEVLVMLEYGPLILLAIMGLLGTLVCWAGLRGLTKLDRVRRLIDVGIGEKLGLKKTDITFADLRDAKGLPLKLVATNVSHGSLTLFSYETTPNVAVADAVAASICLPIVFRPWKVSFDGRKLRFVDGGLLSNLPVWTFDEERVLLPSARTIAFGLEPEPGGGLPSHWLPAAIAAIVSGPPEIHLRGIDGMIHVPLVGDIGVLSFDASFSKLSKVVSEARKAAESQLLRDLTSVPGYFRNFLDRASEDFSRSIKKSGFGSDGKALVNLRLTVSIQRATDRKIATIAYSSDETAIPVQRRVSLDYSSMVGRAWSDKKPSRKMQPKFGPGDRIYPDTSWAVAIPVPILEPKANEQFLARLAVVVIVDSPSPLPASIGETAFELFSHYLYNLASAYFAVEDFGRESRRSIKWLK